MAAASAPPLGNAGVGRLGEVGGGDPTSSNSLVQRPWQELRSHIHRRGQGRGWQCGWISSGYKQTCFSFKDPGVPVTRSLFPIFQGAGKATIEIGMLGDQNGFFSRNPASPPNGGNFLKVGRAEASRKTMKFSGQLPPENLGGYGHKKFFLQNK